MMMIERYRKLLIIQKYQDVINRDVTKDFVKNKDKMQAVLDELQSQLSLVRKESVLQLDSETNARNRVSECQGNIVLYSEAAKKATAHSNISEASTFVSKQHQYEATLSSLETIAQKTQTNVNKLHEMDIKLLHDVDMVKRYMNTL